MAVTHSLSATTPDNPAYEIRPSHWNEAHVQLLTISGNTAGDSTWSGTNLVYSGGANATLSITGNTLVFSGGAGAAGNTGYLSDGANTASLGTINLANANGVTFTLNGQTLSGSVRTNFAGLGESVTTTAGTDLALTVNSDGVSIAHPAWLTTAALSNHSHGNPSLALTNLSGTTASNSAGLTLSLSAAAQSAQSAIEGLGVSNVGNTAGNTGVVTGVDFIMAGSGLLTLSQETGAAARTIHIQHPAWLTTARGSTDAIGLNTAKTNVTWTVNSSGLSLDAAGYAGTGTSATNASITLNSNGLAISVAAPGAAAENNWHHALGANTAGNTTASGSTIGLSGINLTISGTNNSVLNLSVPATSSLVGTSGISVSTNGSTISVQEVPWSNYIVPPDGITIAGSAQANSSVSVMPFYIPRAMAFSHIKILGSFSLASVANTSSASRAYSASIVLYTRNSDTLNSVWSGQQTSNSFARSNSTTALAGVRGINVTGVATTLPPDHYWAAIHFSTTNTGTGGNTTALGMSVSMVVAVAQATGAMQADNWNGGATNQSRALFLGQGLYATGATRASIGLTDANLTQTGNAATLAECILNFQNWTIF